MKSPDGSGSDSGEGIKKSSHTTAAAATNPPLPASRFTFTKAARQTFDLEEPISNGRRQHGGSGHHERSSLNAAASWSGQQQRQDSQESLNSISRQGHSPTQTLF